jgi:hypothetical protein
VTAGNIPLGVIEGATENAAVVQALLDNLVGRGLDPAVCRLFIIDGDKALSKAIRKTFGRHTPIQLPGPQGPQHHRAPCQAPACQRPSPEQPWHRRPINECRAHKSTVPQH